jgi:hypothetical protein
MKIECKISPFTSGVKWPGMGSAYWVRRIPNASLTTPSLGPIVRVGCNLPTASGPLVVPAGAKDTKGSATVQFFDGPHDSLTFLGLVKVLDAKVRILKGQMPGRLGLGEAPSNWEE